MRDPRLTISLPAPTRIGSSALLALLVKTSQKPNKNGLKIIANNVLTKRPLCAKLSLFKTNTRPGGTRKLEREENMKTSDLLAKIETHEQAEIARLAGQKPNDPPAHVEEPSELIDTPTAMGGWWRRRKYADGTISRAYFRSTPPVRYSNQNEIDAARRLQDVWARQRGNLWPQVRLLSGGARGYFDGNRTGRCGRRQPEQTLEEIQAHYGERIAAGGYLSVSARYAAELLDAAKTLGLA